jgi:hypothetical protein
MRQMAKQMDDMKKSNRMLEGSFGRMAKASTLAAGAISSLGPASAGVGALASSFASAGVGAAGFGIVAVSALSNVFEAAEEVEKINEKIKSASSTKDAVAAQKELAAVYGELSKSQRGALKDLQSFKSYWGGYVKEFEKPVFKAFGQSLTFAKNLMNELKPVISVTGDVINSTLAKMNEGFKSDGAKKFFDYLTKTAGPSLDAMLTSTGNITKGFMNLFVAFGPITDSFNSGLVEMTQKFADWSAGLANSKSFQAFIDYAKLNGPVLIETFGNIATTIGNVITALAPFGTTVLNAIKSFTESLAKMTENTDLVKFAVGGLVTGFIAFKVALTALTFIQTVGLLLTSFKKVLVATKTAMIALNLAMRANPIGLLITAITLLVGAGVLLYKNWDLVKEKTRQLWDKLGAFKGVAVLVMGPLGQLIRTAVTMAENWDNTKGVWENVWNGIKISAANAVNDVIGSINGMIGVINKIPGVNVPIVAKVSWAKAAAPQYSVSRGQGRQMSAAGGLSYVPRDGTIINAHRGERILTKAENKAYSSGKGGGKSVNLTVQYMGGGPLDEREMNRFADFLARKIEAAGNAGA